MLALINTKNKQLIETINEGARFKLPNGNIVSPAYAGWEHEAGYALIDIVDAPVIPEGKRIKDAVVELVNDVAVKQYVYEDIPPEPTPDRVSSRQFKLQLDKDGLYDSAVAWVDAQHRQVQIAFHNSHTFDRADRMLHRAFKELGYGPKRVDEFFLAASKLGSEVDAL